LLSASAALLTQLGIACRLAQNLRALEEVCGLGVALLPMGSGFAWWSISAAVAGFGMAMLYPNLSAAVADIAHPSWRASAIEFIAFGAIWAMASAPWGLVRLLRSAESTFWFVAIAMGLSGLVLYHWGEETNPRFLSGGMS